MTITELYQVLNSLPPGILLSVNSVGGSIVLEPVDAHGDRIDGTCPIVTIEPEGKLVEMVGCVIRKNVPALEVLKHALARQC